MNKTAFLVLSLLALSSCGGGGNSSSSSSSSGIRESSESTSTAPTSQSAPASNSTSPLPSSSDSGSSSNAHSHSFSSEWSFDEGHHWHASTCGHEEVSDYAEHTFDRHVVEPTFENGGFTTYTCLICGYSYDGDFTDPLDHNFEEEWSYDENGHYHACTDIGYEDLKSDFSAHSYEDEVIDPTFEEEGYTLHSCSVCGYSYTDNKVAQLEHSYGTDWTGNYLGHFHACTDEGYEDLYTDLEDHQYVTEVTPATLGEGGYTTYTCSVCGYTYKDNFTDPITEEEYYMEFALNPGDESYALVEVKNSPEKLTVPDTHLGLPVTRIGYYAFQNSRSSIRELDMGNNVEILDDYAFFGCSLLSKIRVSPALSIVHENVFDGCVSLEYNTIDGCHYIGNEENPYYILLGVTEDAPKDQLTMPQQTKIIATTDLKTQKINRVIFPDSLIDIPISESFIYINNSFDYNYTIEEKLHYMGSPSYPHLICVGSEAATTNEPGRTHVFAEDMRFIVYGCFYWGGMGGRVVAVEFAGNNVLEIGAVAFQDNTGLTGFVYPETIKKIGNSVLGGCQNNHTLLPDGIGVMPGNCVDKATTQFTFPKSTYAVRANAFAGAWDIEEVDLSQIERLDRGAFSNCSPDRTILTERTRLMEGAFSDYYYYLDSVYFQGDLLSWMNVPLAGNYPFYSCLHLYLADEEGDVVLHDFTYSLLKEVIIPDGVTSIPDYCFYQKLDVTKVVIPDSVTEIGVDVFTKASNIEYNTSGGAIYLGNELHPYAFCFGYDSASAITDVVIADGCHYTVRSAFENNRTITSVTFPDSMEYIGLTAFTYCSSLTTVTFGSGPLVLENSVFIRSSKLLSIDLTHVTTMGQYCLGYCGSLESVIFGEGITSIGESAFTSCSKLKGDVTLPESLHNLGKNAFAGTGITSLHLGAALASGGNENNALALERVTVDENNPYFVAEEGVLYNKEKTSMLCYPAGKADTEFTVPETVLRIERECFYYATKLQTLNVHENLSYIGRYAFDETSLLQTINGAKYLKGGDNTNCYLLEVTLSFTTTNNSYKVADGVKLIAYNAIASKNNLSKITFPTSLKYLNDSALNYLTSLKEIRYEGTVEEWGQVQKDEKWLNNCSAISVVTCSDGTASI